MNKPIILLTTILIPAILVGVIIPLALPSTYMTIGDGAAITDGTILFGTLVGTTLTMVGDGAGIDLGDLTVGAGVDTTAGVATLTMAVGDTQATTVGVAIITTAGDPTTTIDITEEIMPITEPEEAITA